MTNRQPDSVKLPMPVFYALVIIGAFNILIFIAIGMHLLSPAQMPVAITTDVALAMHLQLFEAIIAAVGVALAALGFVGYSTIRNQAVSQADETARKTVHRLAEINGLRAGQDDEVQSPDLSGLEKAETTTEPEKSGI